MKILNIRLLLIMLISVLASLDTTAKNEITVHLDSAQDMMDAKRLLLRLDEINATDRAALTSTEIKALRKEVRLIKGELKELRKGTYIAGSKLVLILLIPLLIFNLAG